VPFVLARAEIDFRAPCHVGERLLIGVRLTQIGSRSFTFGYRLERVADGALLAEAVSVQVMYDYAVGATIAMPSDFRDRLYAIDGEPTA
jgi:acyl-CoA thioester hydrolase